MSKHDTRLIAAFNALPETTQFAMREALLRPTRMGANIPGAKNTKTGLGYVIHSTFVTPLGAEMVRAADAPITEPAKPKRKAKGA